MSQRESSELNALVDRYIAVWHEPDDEHRRQRIAQLWGEDGVQFTSSREICGYEAFEERVKAAHAEFVQTGGFLFRRSGEVNGHHHALLFQWEMVPAQGGEPAAVGTIFLLLGDDGRIRCDYQFSS
jgi:uncharacterized protein